MIARITGSRYEVREALPDFPPPAHRASWYVLGRELSGPKSTAHADLIWLDDGGHLFIQSDSVGDTTEWAGREYGEEGAIVASRIDYSDNKLARRTLAKKLPLVEKRIQDAEEILQEVSSTSGVPLTLHSEGEGGLCTFSFIAEVDAKELNAEREKNVARVLDALKRSWDRAEKIRSS
jgi:hypothetical protein